MRNDSIQEFTKAGRDKLKHKIGVFIDIFPMYPAAPNAFIDFFYTNNI